MKRVISWILFLFSFISLSPSVYNFFGLFGLPHSERLILSISLFFIVFCFFSHLLIKNYRAQNKKGGKVIFILTYPAYIIPKLCIWLIIALFMIIVKLIGYFNSIVANNNNNKISKSKEIVYFV